MQSTSKCTAAAPVPSLDLHPSFMADTGRWRSLELRLMHHYTAVVSHTMPGCSYSPTEAWIRTIPQLAFRFEVLLNPMLALSALHLHAHSSNDTEMQVALSRYLDRSIVSHRQALLKLDDAQSEALWLSAILLAHMFWLLTHQALPNEAYKLPLQSFKILEGVGALFEQKIASLEQLGYGWNIADCIPQIATADRKLSEAAHTELQDIEADLANLMDAFNVAELPDRDRSIYTEARDYVLFEYRGFLAGADPRIFERFIGYIVVKSPSGYLPKLEQYDPLAMALMARILVLISEGKDDWWMKGRGVYEVMERDVRGIREVMPAHLRWTMDWPCRVLDGEVILTKGGQKIEQRGNQNP